VGTTSTGREPRRTCIGARIDIETKSATPIDAGSYRYAEDLHFEALVISYSPIWRYPGGTERLGAIRTLDQRNAQQVATFQRILTEPRFQKHAFNANFERVALSRWLNMPTGFYLDPENWRCSAVLANVHGVFGTLDEVARAVRSPIQKDPEGRRLIKLFSVPETRKRTGVPDNNPFHSPGPGDCWCGQNHVADFGKFRAYCENDVRTEALVAASFPGMPPELQAEYEADQRINDRGVRHFKGLSEAAVRQVEAERDRLMGELKARTGLANPNSIQQMRGWLDDQGYPMLSLAKEPREEALADPSCPPHVAEVLQLKGNASLSSVAKHQAALKQRSGDGRVRGAFRFYGAHTGREAGRGIQPQNLPRYEASDADRRRLLFGAAGRDAPRIAKGTVRSSLVPAKGHVFVVCDYNAIEARVLGAFAGEKWVEAEFRGAGKIYEATAETVLGVPKQRIIAARAKCEECGKCEECAVRQQAKVACLALGYAGGAGALVTMGAEGAGIDCGNYKELHAQWLALGAPGKFHEWNRDAHHYPALLALRDAYRDNSPATVRFWKQCAMAWDLAAVTGSPSTWGQNECLQMVRDGRHNRLVLPSGRSIWYRFARSHADPENPERIDRRTFIGKSSGVGHSRTDTHGGKLTENLTQAGARDVMFDLLMQIEQMTAGGWPGRTVMHVHDEVVIETPERSADRVLQDTLGLMSTSPTWAPFLPVKGGGKIMERYGK